MITNAIIVFAADSPVVTLCSLYKQDLDEAYFLTVYPSTYHLASRWINSDRYRVCDNIAYARVVQIFTLRVLSVLGNEFPLISEVQPRARLIQHWKECIPEYPMAKTVEPDKGLEQSTPTITVFPLQDIPTDRHAVDPSTHYKILLKSSIPQIGVQHPRYMERDDLTFPALVKIGQFLSNYGNFIIHNHNDLNKALQDVAKQYDEKVAQECVVTELIEDSTETFCCHFYVNKKGESQWMGATKNISNNFNYQRSVSDWDEDDVIRTRFFDAFVDPVGDYLHRNGYFGWVCVDIVVVKRIEYSSIFAIILEWSGL